MEVNCLKCDWMSLVHMGHGKDNRYWCRKLGMSIYPRTNGHQPCCWFNYYDPSEDPKKPGDPYP